MDDPEKLVLIITLVMLLAAVAWMKNGHDDEYFSSANEAMLYHY